MQQPGVVNHPHSTIEHEFPQVLRIEILLNLMDEDCALGAPHRMMDSKSHGTGPSVFQALKVVNLAKLLE